MHNYSYDPNYTIVIQRDARDPQLLANLSKLGPVRVDHHMQTIRTVSPKKAFCFTAGSH